MNSRLRPTVMIVEEPSTKAAHSTTETTELVALAIRHWLAVLLAATAGTLVGCVFYLQMPVTYRATSRLMVDSDKAMVLNTITGDVIGGVPGIEVVRSQLIGDRVSELAFSSPEFKPYRVKFDGDTRKFADAAEDALVLESELADFQTGQSLVFLMHYDSVIPGLPTVAVRAYSDALQQLFNERKRDSRSELLNLIQVAMEEVHPHLSKLESDYRVFRSSAPLAWDSTGVALNPHRERQIYLTKRRRELAEDLRQKELDTASIQAVTARAKNPLLALGVLQRVVDARISVSGDDAPSTILRDGDATLAEIELDRNLVPLMIERNKFAAQFGANHPSVKTLDAELVVMRRELARLVREEAQRIFELDSDNRESSSPTKMEDAADAVAAFFDAVTTQTNLLKRHLEELDRQIKEEQTAAIEVAQFEEENEARLREIERFKALTMQLEEQMARVNLSEEESKTRVEELTAPGQAYRIGPTLVKPLGIGLCAGLAFGLLLAFVLERSQHSFSNSSEIASILGVPVLCHIPYQRRWARPRKNDSFPSVHNSVAVAHQPESMFSESIRTLRTSVLVAFADSKHTVLQVTSPLPGDGKSTITTNLACALAQAGKRVVALDGDLRRPRLTEIFSLADKPGLTHVLNGEQQWREAIHETPLPNLHVMPSGQIPSNPAEALTLPDMQDTLHQLREDYDFVLLDTPPLLVVTDPSILASMSDGVLMTLRVRRKSRQTALEAINILHAVNAKILGVAINNSDGTLTGVGYEGSSSYRNGHYGKAYYSRYRRRSRKADSSSRVTVRGRDANSRSSFHTQEDREIKRLVEERVE